MFNLIEEIQQFKNSELTVEIIRLKLTVKIVPTGMISETDDLIIENFQLDSADYLSGSKKTPFQEQHLGRYFKTAEDLNPWKQRGQTGLGYRNSENKVFFLLVISFPHF